MHLNPPSNMLFLESIWISGSGHQSQGFFSGGHLPPIRLFLIFFHQVLVAVPPPPPGFPARLAGAPDAFYCILSDTFSPANVTAIQLSFVPTTTVIGELPIYVRFGAELFDPLEDHPVVVSRAALDLTNTVLTPVVVYGDLADRL